MSSATTTATEATDRLTLGAASQRKERSPFITGLLSLRRNKVAMVGAFIFLAWILVALLAPLIAPHDPNAQDLSNRLEGPGAGHWFGTDELGRDILSRVM